MVVMKSESCDNAVCVKPGVEEYVFIVNELLAEICFNVDEIPESVGATRRASCKLLNFVERKKGREEIRFLSFRLS